MEDNSVYPVVVEGEWTLDRKPTQLIMTICAVFTSYWCQTMFVCPSLAVLDKTVTEFPKLLECYLIDGSVKLVRLEYIHRSKI